MIRLGKDGNQDLTEGRLHKPVPLIAVLLAATLSACNTPTEAVQSASQQKVSAATAVPPAEAATQNGKDQAGTEATAAKVAGTAPSKVIQQKSTVPQRGTYIRVLVNNQPITNYDIQRRQKFRQLRRLSTSQDDTIKELVDEKIKITAAQQAGVYASEAESDRAFDSFAKNNKSTPERISADLDRIGIGAEHFKQYIRVQLSWNRLAGQKLQRETQQKTQSDAIFELRKSGQEKPQTTEYLLQQIIFVIPQDKAKSMVKARTDEALAFRQRYEGCEKAVELAKQLKDVAVKDLGRKLEPELPPNWIEPLKAIQQGQLTQPQTTEKGVEMLGICRATTTSDDRAAQVMSQAQAYDQLEEKGDAAADAYLAELRETATIIYR
jgi:peptidyl-prolyl cis-trans isomerase SurA